MPKVSVVIPAYNAAAFISETIDSALAQTYQDMEIIVVDDGSTDDTGSVIRAYGEKVRYIRQENSGVSVARNTAIAAAEGEFIALLDHDDLWLPEKLEEQVRLIDSRPEVGLVYSDAYLIDATGKVLRKHSDKTPLPRGNVLAQLFVNSFIICSTVLLRRRSLDEVGLFDPQFAIAEEHALFISMAEKYEFEVVHLPLAKYRIHEGYSRRNIERGQKEAIAVVNQYLAQNPGIEREIGRRAVKIKLAGLWCTLGQAYLLQGKFSRAREELGGSINLLKTLPKTLAFYVLSFLGPDVVTVVLKIWRSPKR